MIKLNNLQAGYRAKSPVLKDVNLTLQEDRIYGLLGSNGSGKTTLLNTLAGALEPLGGKIEVLGYTPLERKAKFLEQIAYIQDELELPSMSAEQFVESYAAFRPMFSNGDMNRYLKMMNFTFGIRLDKLSLGNRKKFAIAFALATHPRIVLMDEPTNGLDIESKQALRKILAGQDLSERLIIISSHQVADIEDIISDVIILRENRIVLNSSLGAIGEVLQFGDIQNIEEPLYVNGLKAIGKAEGDYSDVDLESFYLAMQNSENMRNYLSKVISKK